MRRSKNQAQHSSLASAGSTISNVVVDLDGTLIKTDLLFESLLRVLSKNPFLVFLLPFWLLSGRARLKDELSRRAVLDASLLPYRQEVLSYLLERKAQGARIILATASNETFAHAVANHLRCIDEVMASTSSVNLKGTHKARALQFRFVDEDFEYIGDSLADIPVWEVAGKAVIVSHKGSRVLAATKRAGFPTADSIITPKTYSALFRAIRVRQWVKNSLLFLPLFMAHEFASLSLWFSTVLGFFAFSFLASAVYLLNDLLDLDSDRAHPSKRFRPLAAGEISIPLASLVAVVLLGSAAVISTALPQAFQSVLALYFCTTCYYTFHGKRVPVLDIIILASLYSLRIFAGGVAVGVPVSQWLLTFSIFIFVSLACIKRLSELLAVKNREEQFVKGRGYQVSDLDQIAMFGASSGYLSVLVMALYVSSDEVKMLYSQPELLWLICPVLLYWISRAWLLAHRGEIHEDPVVFALTDRVSYLSGIISALIVLIAI